jgi:hypothetical protein
MTTIRPADLLEIRRLHAYSGHVVDRAEWGELSGVFASHAVLDVHVPGLTGTHAGVDKIRQAYESEPNYRPGNRDAGIRAVPWFAGSGRGVDGGTDEVTQTPWFGAAGQLRARPDGVARCRSRS